MLQLGSMFLTKAAKPVRASIALIATATPARTASPSLTATATPTPAPAPIPTSTPTPTPHPHAGTHTDPRPLNWQRHHRQGRAGRTLQRHHGPNWADNTNWLSDRPLGEWYRVANDANGRVAHVHLDDCQLTGEIPAKLGRLAIAHPHSCSIVRCFG